MAISFVAASAVVTGANPTIAIPAGYAEGDLLIIVNTNGGMVGTPATPTGWTQRYAQPTNEFITILTKYASSTETSVSLSVTPTTNKAVMLCYRGAGSYDVISTIAAGSGTTATTNTQTTTYADDYVISIFSRNSVNGSSSFTVPAGTTSRVNSGTTPAVMGVLVVDELKATAGLTTARSSTFTSGLWSAIAISFVPTRTLYWVGGAGTWNTTTTGDWANTSGGTPGTILPPVPNENVIIDASSGTGSITCSGALCKDLTVTASQAITLGGSGTNTLTISGNLSLPSGGSMLLGTPSSFTITFNASSTGKTITTNAKTLPSLTFNGVGGGWALQDALTSNSDARTLTLTNGSFNANGFAVTYGLLSSSNSNTRTLTLGNGLWTLTGTGTVWNISTTTGLTFNKGTSNIELSDTSTTSKTFQGGGLTYNNLSITATTGVATYIFGGSNTFNTLSVAKTVTSTLSFTSGTTQTITTFTTSSASSGNELVIRSSTTGSTAALAITNSATRDYANVLDMTTSGGAQTITNGYISRSSTGWTLGNGSKYFELLTSGTSFTVPSTWTSTNEVHLIGGGGGGAGNLFPQIAGGAGGGGGGYSKVSNFVTSPGSAITYAIGAAGAGGSGSGSSSSGTSGGQTSWNSGTSTASGGGGGSSTGIPNTISFVNANRTTQNSPQTTINVSMPSGITNGNLLIAVLTSSNTGNAWNVPSGWTAPASSANGRRLFWRVASSEPGSYTFTQTNPNTSTAFVLVYANAQFDVTGLASQSASGTITPVAITVGAANSTIIYVASTDSTSGVTYTTPTGYTQRESDSDGTTPSARVWSLAGVAAGSYTAPSTTASTGTARAYITSIKPTVTSATSTGGAGGIGSGGTLNYTGGTGGAGNTTFGAVQVMSGGGGGAAGPNGNGGNGGSGSSGADNVAGSGGGGGNGGGSAGGNGTSTTAGAGGNNSLGTGGGAVGTSSTDASAGTVGGGGGGGVSLNRNAGDGGSGADIIPQIYGSGGGTGGNLGALTRTSGNYGGGGGGASTNSSGGARSGNSGAQGAIVLTWGSGSTITSGNFFFLFM